MTCGSTNNRRLRSWFHGPCRTYFLVTQAWVGNKSYASLWRLFCFRLSIQSNPSRRIPLSQQASRSFHFPEPPCYLVLYPYGKTDSIVNPYTLSAVFFRPHRTSMKSSWFCTTRMKCVGEPVPRTSLSCSNPYSWLWDFLFTVVSPKKGDCFFLYRSHEMMCNLDYVSHAETSLLSQPLS
jgi:hypothetical protein